MEYLETIKSILKSKKFYYALVTFLIITCGSSIGISEGEMANIIWVVIALIVSQGIADYKGCKK
tara:strand:- start:484 stop:675 length:192 start_codon:yes stop_codon:yes gene_type:complete